MQSATCTCTGGLGERTYAHDSFGERVLLGDDAFAVFLPHLLRRVQRKLELCVKYVRLELKSIAFAQRARTDAKESNSGGQKWQQLPYRIFRKDE